MSVEPQPLRGSKGKILFIISGLQKDGAETQLVRLAIALVDRGWDPTIVTMIDHNDFQSELARADIKVHTLAIPRGRKDPRSLPRLIRLLRVDKPDVVCTFMYHANVLGRIAARLARVPVVVSSIRNEVFGGRFAEFLMIATAGLDDVTTTNSVLAAETLLSRGVVRKQRLTVIPNAIVDSSPSRPGLTSAELLPPGLKPSWLWLSVGRLEPQKGHEIALRAMALLKDRGVDCHLLIAGRGPLELELKTLCTTLGIEEDVTFLGYRSDVRDFMAVSNGFVLASLWEGLPNVVLESCAAGLPVVATDVGGVREIVVDGVTGVVVAPGDVEALANGMYGLMTLGAEGLEKVSKAARTDVESRFSAAPVMAAWDGLFTSVLKRRRRRQ